jgi:nucleoside-diphosphate-sugar epimerase
VTHILHAAWTVDFNLSIDSFDGNHIYGTRQFIDFSARSARGACIFFISTVGTVMEWNSHQHGKVPEQVLEDWTMPQPGGYAESKYVAERLLWEANKVAGVPSVICRIGQVAGPTTKIGMWSKQEWLPSLIASSKYLGKFPASLGPLEIVDWIPVDILARIILDLLHGAEDDNRIQTGSEELNDIRGCANGEEQSQENSGLLSGNHVSTPVYHVVNPSKATWSELLPAVLQYAGASLEVVSFNDWVHALRQSSSMPEHIGQNPAMKLMDFFEDLQKSVGKLQPMLDTAKTIRRSETMARLGPVSVEWMATWMSQWVF